MRADEAAALGLRPDSTSVPHQLQTVISHLQAGKLNEAGALCHDILRVAPGQPDALHLLGWIADVRGQHDVAVDLISKALESAPNFAEAHNNLGVALQNLGKLEEAVASHQKSIALRPDLSQAHFNLGNALKKLNRYVEAANSFRTAISLQPDYAEAYSNLGAMLQEQGRLTEAIAQYQKAISLKPDYAEAFGNIGMALQQQGETAAAIEKYQRALQLNPGLAGAYKGLAISYQRQGKLAEAINCNNEAIRLDNQDAEAHNNLGNVLKDQGRLDEALACYRQALKVKPGYAMAYSNLLFLHSYHASPDQDEYLSLARNWETACIPVPERLAARSRHFKRESLAGRRLKVGYVSGDFRQHAVSYFAERLFQYHDRARVELFAYSTNVQRDDVTDRLQSSVDHFVDVATMDDSAVVERINADGIDVLIDLSGHTAHNRLGVFARRSAPVQAHYLGYFASTGLTQMDYWIADDVIAPREMDKYFSEQIWRLPRVWLSYDGRNAPATQWCPSPDGSVWVGSFNNLGKLTPETLALWARVLTALPEGRLLLKNKELSDAGNRQRILDALAGHGIAPERIELQPASHWLDYMACHDKLDIALDPVGGHGGGTSTCDALWMGVPVIHLLGDHVGSRFSASILTALDHPEWIATTQDEYVDKVVTLARDVVQRKALRFEQRIRMAQSPLCDAKDLAAKLEQAYCEMFGRWLDKGSC